RNYVVSKQKRWPFAARPLNHCARAQANRSSLILKRAKIQASLTANKLPALHPPLKRVHLQTHQPIFRARHLSPTSSVAPPVTARGVRAFRNSQSSSASARNHAGQLKTSSRFSTIRRLTDLNLQ